MTVPLASAIPKATAPPILSSLRALLLATVASYIEQAQTLEPRDPGISELEIQRVAYLLIAQETSFPLQFARGRYGPYSEGLARVLEDMEGHYLTGLGDRSARVTESVPINLVPGTQDKVRAVLADHPDQTSRATELLSLVQGFESPYGVELLATVHFAAQQSPCTHDATELGTRVRSWNQRRTSRTRLFTQYQVEVAAQRLTEFGLLPS